MLQSSEPTVHFDGHTKILVSGQQRQGGYNSTQSQLVLVRKKKLAEVALGLMLVQKALAFRSPIISH